VSAVGVANGAKKLRRKVDGVLLLDKPIGMSSNQALQAARRILNAQKGGHTGTLDPLATGLLPLCFGEATKFAGELLDADKTYLATLKLGITTDTGDAEGRELLRREVSSSRTDVLGALAHFLGEIEQIPPMYSALKRDGKPLYEYARAGIEVERKPRQIKIRRLTLTDWTADQVSLNVTCSKGTYIRTLAEDIGERLGCGAHLIALRRIATGGMEVTSAVSLEALQAMTERERDAVMLPVDMLVAHLPVLYLDAARRARVMHGQAFECLDPATIGASPSATAKSASFARPPCSAIVFEAVALSTPSGVLAVPIDPRIRLYDQGGQFLGLGTVSRDGHCQPLRLVATN